MTAIRAEVLLATASDERYPPSNCVDGNLKTFFLTTGMYPHEIILGFKGGSVDITSIRTVSNGIKQLRIERCVDSTPVKFQALTECTLTAVPEGQQIEQFNIPRGVGQGISFLKVVIESGYDAFAAVYEIHVEGQENQAM